MEDCFNTGCLSFFTSNHDKHDKEWLQKGSQLTVVCFACFVEIIENNNEQSIRKTRTLHELLNLISAGNIVNILKANDSVVYHLLNCLWELMPDFDENNPCSDMTVVEIICQLCCSLKSEAFVGKVMEYLSQKITAAENMKKVFPQLDLLGKLLQKIPGLANNVVHSRQNIMTYIAKGLDSDEERIQSLLYFIITHLYRDEDCYSAVPVTTTETIFQECCEALTNATSKELQINSIALLQSLTRPENLPKNSQMLEKNIERAIISLKKAFLSKDDLVKSLAIGCLDNLVLHDESIIDSDLTGFLFEVFTTKSESLLSLGFQCLSQMVEKQGLYTKGHVVYGFETILSALIMVCENKNAKLIKQGLGVLAKILGNCPLVLSLISSKNVLLQCLDVINRVLHSPDDGVFLQACRCFSSFLERRHFSCDVPYGRLMALIEPLVERLGKSSKSTGHWNHAENKDLQSSMIDAILEVIKKSLDLVLGAKNESPTLEALLVSQENNATKEFEEFVNKLLQLCDQVCIPNVIANFKKFYGTGIPEKFFEILNRLLWTCPMESMKEMSEKFVSSCFIRIALDTKAYYLGRSSSEAFQQSVNKFLEIICCRLSSPGHITPTFCARLQNINGSTEELLQVLKENNSGNEALRETQECIFVIFRLAYLYDDRLVTTSQLLHALSSFLVLNPAYYENSVIIPRCLTQLYITELHRHGDSSNDTPQLDNANRILADGISKYVNHLEDVYFHDFAMVEWALETQDLNPALRKEILELWFSQSEDSDLGIKEMEMWQKLVKRYPGTLLFLASILGTEETHAQNEILRVLQHVLSACATESDAFQNTSKELKIAIQKLLLTQAVEPLPDKNMSSVLKLLCLLVTSGPEGPLDNYFMKLIYHVTNLLKQSENSEISTECLNFLNASVIHEADSGSDQVLGFLLKHHDCNKFLESVIDSFPNAMDLETSSQNNSTLAAVLVSISYLTRFQKIFGITSEDKVEINIEVMLSLLCYTASPLLQFAANIFWASIFQTDESTSLVSLRTKLPSNTGTSNQELNKKHLRIILVRLQNSLLHSNPLVQMSALRCLEAFLSSEKDVKDFLQDPWNKIMLREVNDLASSESASLLPLKLYSLFLNQERENGMNLDLPVMDLLGIALVRFGEYEISSDPNCLEWLSAYARFFLEVIQWKSDAMTSFEKSNLKYQVEHLMDSYPEAEVSKKQNGFVRVQEVLIHVEMIQGKRIDPLQTLQELSDLLK